MSPRRIEALVAQVLNAKELVINKGSADGVKVGMRFAILNRKGKGITDPTTGEELGSVELEKAVVKIVRVYDRLSVGRTFRTTPATGLAASIAFGALLGQPSGPETLKTDERTYQQELDEKDSFVHRGDPAVEMKGDEFNDD